MNSRPLDRLGWNIVPTFVPSGLRLCRNSRVGHQPPFQICQSCVPTINRQLTALETLFNIYINIVFPYVPVPCLCSRIQWQRLTCFPNISCHFLCTIWFWLQSLFCDRQIYTPPFYVIITSITSIVIIIIGMMRMMIKGLFGSPGNADRV